ncbi:Uncharacterized protein Adt_11054 [Abeliophyllum distichum]|uniref:Uncharacterized protein n=1 Tax=Abeliophyllum distichum TaxID=126358 RepID=A0ABD1ULY6_9LAMI
MHTGFIKSVRQRRDKMRRVARDLFPKIEIKLLKKIEMAGGHKVNSNGGSQWYVKNRDDDPSKYVHDCYKVSTYLICYENIVMPNNGQKLWPVVEKDPIKPPGWIVYKKGRKQKKMRRHLEEFVKHLPKRSNRKCIIVPGLQPPLPKFQFMPTPGVGLSNTTTMYNKSNSAIDNLDRSRFSEGRSSNSKHVRMIELEIE